EGEGEAVDVAGPLGHHAGRAPEDHGQPRGRRAGRRSLHYASAATRSYTVVRCSRLRPRGSTMARKAASSMRWPCEAPAAREMFSSIKVPPRSLAPARRAWAAPSAPIFTHETWMFVSHGW